MPSAAAQPSAEFGRRPPCRPDGARVGDRGSTGGWAVEQGDRARAWDQLPHGRGPPRSDYGQDPGSPLFGAGALGSWCGSPAWDGPRRPGQTHEGLRSYRWGPFGEVTGAETLQNPATGGVSWQNADLS